MQTDGRKAVSPLCSILRCASPRQAATAVQIFVVRARSCRIVLRMDTDFYKRLTTILPLRFDRGLELFGKQRKEFARGEGPLRAE